MATVEELEVLLGEARAELVVAQHERDEAQKQCADHGKTIKMMSNRYSESLDEIKRVAMESYKLVEGLEQHMKAGDALRNRLAKVTDALAKGDAFILALETYKEDSDKLDPFRAEYNESKLFLQTMDG